MTKNLPFLKFFTILQNKNSKVLKECKYPLFCHLIICRKKNITCSLITKIYFTNFLFPGNTFYGEVNQETTFLLQKNCLLNHISPAIYSIIQFNLLQSSGDQRIQNAFIHQNPFYLQFSSRRKYKIE